MRFLLLLVAFVPLALAAPRVGVHNSFTRLVFDLTKGTHYTLSINGRTLKLSIVGVTSPPRDQRLNTPEVSSYQTVPISGGTAYLVHMLPGVTQRSFTLPGEGTTLRLVIDFSMPAAAPPPKPSPPTPVVILDPGHGGWDPGAIGYVIEKQITLDVALRVRKLLEAQGVKVIMTRTSDTALGSQGQVVADLAGRAALAAPGRTLFVSIHVNSAPNPAHGIETYYLGRALDSRVLELAIYENGGGKTGQQLTRAAQTSTDQALADLVAQTNLTFSRKLASTVESDLVKITGATDRGIHTAPFYVLRNARIPAILTEVGFANDPTEGRRLAEASYRREIAEGITDGILAFLANGAYAFHH